VTVPPAARPSNIGTAIPLMTGTLTRYALLAVNIAVGVFMMPFTVRHLGQSEYGLWMLVASLTYYFQLLDLGYGSGVVRQVTEADARDDTVRVNRILSTFVGVYGAIGALAAVGLVALIFLVLPRFPRITAAQLPTAQALLAIIGLRMVVGFPMSVFGAVTNARQRFALNNGVAIVLALGNAVVTYLVLSTGHGLLPLVEATTALSLLGYVAYAWTAHQAFPALDLRPRLFDRRIVREVTTFSVYFFMIDIAVQIGFNLDNVVIAGFLGTAAVAVYAVTLRIADYQRQLCSQFNNLLFPVVVRFGSVGRADALRDTLVEGTRIALVLVVGVTVSVIGFASPLVVAWMGPGFDGSVAPLVVLAITGVALVGQGPLGNVLLGTGRHRLVAVVAFVEALANLALSLVLVKRLGILGVALGTAIPVLLANSLTLLPAACRTVGLRVTEFARLVLPGPLAGAGPAIVAVVGFRLLLPTTRFGAVVAQGALVGALYMASVVMLGMTPAVRNRYVHHATVLLLRARLWVRPLAAPRVAP
jgi:O-antigen/teichoic acid export membrane protein